MIKSEISLNICFLSYRKNFIGTQKRVRINHGKRAIGVRAIVVRLCLFLVFASRTAQYSPTRYSIFCLMHFFYVLICQCLNYAFRSCYNVYKSKSIQHNEMAAAIVKVFVLIPCRDTTDFKRPAKASSDIT